MAISDRLDQALRRARASTSEGGERVTDSEVEAAVTLARTGPVSERLSDGDIIDSFSRTGGPPLLARLEETLHVHAVPQLRTGASADHRVTVEGRHARTLHAHTEFVIPHTFTVIRGRAESDDLSAIFNDMLRVTYGITNRNDPRLAQIIELPEMASMREDFINQRWSNFRVSRTEGSVVVSLTLPTGLLIPRAAD